jgi:hypothetical protein
MKDFFLLIIFVAILIGAGVVLYKNSDAVPTAIVPASETEAESESEIRESKKTVEAGLKQKVTFNNIGIEPWAVTEDSRCSSDVQCIQAGKAVVALNVTDNGVFIKTVEIQETHSLKVGNTRITLEKVGPYPVSTAKTTDGEYRFTFVFETVE